jgi:hypothetical protein
MFKRFDHTNIPGVTYAGPFASITPKELKAWLGKGVIIHICDPRGNTHLHRAVMEGAKPFVIEFLLDRGVDINARNEAGETALIIAAWYGRHELVELLLKRGADPNVKTREGLSALKVASKNGHGSTVDMLLAHGAKPGRKGIAAPAKATGAVLAHVHCAADEFSMSQPADGASISDTVGAFAEWDSVADEEFLTGEHARMPETIPSSTFTDEMIDEINRIAEESIERGHLAIGEFVLERIFRNDPKLAKSKNAGKSTTLK